jgi:hypothetical protein
MKYDFAHPKFKNGMVTFAEKKPDLLYEFRQAAIRRHYVLRPDMVLYTPSHERLAKVENYFDILVVTKFNDIGSIKLRSKQDIDRFFREMDESYDYKGEHTMTLTEAKQILKAHNYILERGRPFSDPSNRADFYDPDYYHADEPEHDIDEDMANCRAYADAVQQYLEENYPDKEFDVDYNVDDSGDKVDYTATISMKIDHLPTEDDIIAAEDIFQAVAENVDDCDCPWDDRSATIVCASKNGISRPFDYKNPPANLDADYFEIVEDTLGSKNLSNDYEPDFDEDVDPDAY